VFTFLTSPHQDSFPVCIVSLLLHIPTNDLTSNVKHHRYLEGPK